MKLITFIMVQLFLPLLMASAGAAQDSFVYFNQGWTNEEIAKASHWNLGTELMPARWFFALERDDSSQKLSDNLERFGFIVAKDGLPVGVTLDENDQTAALYKEKKWIGVNCAACHTSALQIKDKTFIVNGDQSELRIQDFEESIVKSVETTLTDSQKMSRFVKNLSETDTFDLTDRLRLFLDEFREANIRNHHYIDRQGTEVRWGPGRIDGLGDSTNNLTCVTTPRMGNPFWNSIFISAKNCGPSHAPTSIPHLWGMTNQDLVQWNGEVHASLPRNVGALMSGYGKNWVESGSFGLPKVVTTVKIEEFGKVEDLYKKLKAPVWQDIADQKLGPELDSSKVARGSKIFEQNCQSCHAVQPKLTAANKFGNYYWDYPLIKVETLGTDPFYTSDELQRQAVINPLLARVFELLTSSKLNVGGPIPAVIVRGVLPVAAIATYKFENHVSSSELDKMSNCRGDKSPPIRDGIKAKSLEGVLFTAPYLHNGSVPTIYDLLEHAAKRPGKFFTGCRKYDIEKFGFDCGRNDVNAFEFDTSLQGNSNSGHEYGTSLSTDEKVDLVEFLKSLTPPTYKPGNSNCN